MEPRQFLIYPFVARSGYYPTPTYHWVSPGGLDVLRGSSAVPFQSVLIQQLHWRKIHRSPIDIKASFLLSCTLPSLPIENRTVAMSDPNAAFQNFFYLGNTFNAILYGSWCSTALDLIQAVLLIRMARRRRARVLRRDRHTHPT